MRDNDELDPDSVLYDPLDRADPARPYLWGITFIKPNESEEDRTRLRHYHTWCITAEPPLYSCCGMLAPEHHHLYSRYKIIDEFSSIAKQLFLCDLWPKYNDLWYSALSSALWKEDQKEQEKDRNREFYDKLIELYHQSRLLELEKDNS